jgi:hypothetical protein
MLWNLPCTKVISFFSQNKFEGKNDMSKFFSKENKGAMTLEATIAVPVFMFAVLSIAFFTRVIYIQNHFQSALNKTAVELSTYSYLYHVSNLSKLHNDFSDVLNVMENLSNTSNTPSNQPANILSNFAKKEFQEQKGFLLESLVKKRLKENLNASIFKPTNVGAYIVVSTVDPLDSISFKGSNLFDDNKTIDIMVSYKVKIKLPIDFIEPLTINQRAIIKGFLGGDNSSRNSVLFEDLYANEDNEYGDLWNNEKYSPMERGKIITKLELSKIDLGTDELFEVRSIDISLKSYDTEQKLLYTMKSEINKLYAKSNKNKAQNRKKTLLIVVPQGALQNIPSSLITKASEYSNVKGITLQFKEGYGKSDNS